MDSTAQRRVLFVCSGNTCRSPMAQAIAVEIATDRGEEEDVLFESAGLSPGGRVSPEALKALEAIRVESKTIRGRRSRSLDFVLERDHWDLVVVMEYAMKSQVGPPQWPATKVMTIKELANESGDLEDPIGKGERIYMETAREIRRLLENGWKLLSA